MHDGTFFIFKGRGLHIIDGNKILYTLLHEDSYSYKVFDTFDEAKEAIDKLPEKYKTVFILKDIEEFTNQEIADILGISLPAVKSRLLRARLKVRELLASYGKEALV